jgi:hypothetical protein|tara:strand:- start:142 stop:393 length:252 start_codon:yes stop_codon:yes gene_type:complete
VKAEPLPFFHPCGRPGHNAYIAVPYSHIMSFEDMRRNAFRFRRASARPRVTNKNSHTLEIYEALEAQKLGLDEKIATPLKEKF